MKLLTLSRNVLLACLLVPACGDDKADDSTATDGTSNATPATPATPASGTETDTNATPASGTETDPTASVPTEDPSGDPSTDPSGDPSTDPTGDTTTDPTGGDGQYCQESCSIDDDCTQMGMNTLGYKCVDNRCTLGCDETSECVALFSGFVTPCVDQAGCPNQVCIDIGGGEGRCATAPSDFFMCNTLPGFSDVMYPPIEGGEPVTVCGNSQYECTDGQCQNPCADDSECVVPGFTKCYTDTGTCGCPDDSACSGDTPKCQDNGVCGCESDANCTSDPNRPVCTADGFCGCGADADCVAAGNGDKCYDGACGCSDVAVCPDGKVFDGTMLVCEGF